MIKATVQLEIGFCNECPDSQVVEYPVSGRKHNCGMGNTLMCFNKKFMYPQVIGRDKTLFQIPSGCPRTLREYSYVDTTTVRATGSNDIVAKVIAASELLYGK